MLPEATELGCSVVEGRKLKVATVLLNPTAAEGAEGVLDGLVGKVVLFAVLVGGGLEKEVLVCFDMEAWPQGRCHPSGACRQTRDRVPPWPTTSGLKPRLGESKQVDSTGKILKIPRRFQTLDAFRFGFFLLLPYSSLVECFADGKCSFQEANGLMT